MHNLIDVFNNKINELHQLIFTYIKNAHKGNLMQIANFWLNDGQN